MSARHEDGVTAADKILLSVDEVVEHSLDVAQADAKARETERREQEAEMDAAKLDRFRKTLSGRLDISPEGINEPRLEVEHDGCTLVFFWHDRVHGLHVNQRCPKCGDFAWSSSRRVVDHESLGYALMEASADSLCNRCMFPARPPIPDSEPTLAERLYELVREIAAEEVAR